MTYNLGEIRKLITAALDDDEFTNLCLDHFRSVYDNFTTGQTRSVRVRMLVEYADRRRKIPKLLKLVQETNPKAYAEFELRLGVMSRSQLEELATAEQIYRERIKARFGQDAPYYVSLAGETTEVDLMKAGPKAPRSARRRGLRPEYREWIQEERELKRIKLNTLREGVDKYACLILLGEPGSGKTTALEHLAYEFAADPNRLPVPLRLSEFQPGMTVEEFIMQGWGGAEAAGHWGAVELAANLEGYLEAGRLFFFFDALNEMPPAGYKDQVMALRQFIDQGSAQGNRFLVTCRVLDYGEELAGLQRIEVQPLNNEQIKMFLGKELPEDWNALWQRLESNDNLLTMGRNPYMLTAMVDVFAENGQLSEKRAKVMERFTEILIKRAEEKWSDKWLEVEVQREALAGLAFEMQLRSSSGTIVKTRHIQKVMPTKVQIDPNYPPDEVSPEDVLNQAASVNIIEMPVDRSSVRFYHQLLQEYFTARQMLRQDPAGLKDFWRWPWLEAEMPVWVRPDRNYDPLPPPPPTGWEEATILAAGLRPENDDQLVQALIQVNPVLAGRCLYEGQAQVDKAVHQAVIQALVTTIARPEVALRVRIAAGEVLGYLGDPRIGEMVTIPAGNFLMGDDKGEYDDEKPQHELYLPEYRIGKYPLTNAEYARFMEDKGYFNRRWWTEAGWAAKKEENWTQPEYWDNIRFNKPNQPVVGVSWYECVAYCRWLSAQTGQPYHLPSEAQWEKAARGSDGRVFPWGNEFEAGRVNTAEGDQVVQATTPVGIYPGGASSFGLLDCAGNVWEWCVTQAGDDGLNLTLKTYPYDIREDEGSEKYLSGTNVRALRGGSWAAHRFYARCAVRSWDLPDLRLVYLGCRVAGVSPI